MRRIWAIFKGSPPLLEQKSSFDPVWKRTQQERPEDEIHRKDAKDAKERMEKRSSHKDTENTEDMIAGGTAATGDAGNVCPPLPGGDSFFPKIFFSHG